MLILADAAGIGFGELHVDLLHARIVRLRGHLARIGARVPDSRFRRRYGRALHPPSLYKRQLAHKLSIRTMPVGESAPIVDKYTPIGGGSVLTTMN